MRTLLSGGPTCFAQPVRVAFGHRLHPLAGGGAVEARIAIPCLGSQCAEWLPPVPGDLSVGAEVVPLDPDLRRLEAVTREVYARILEQAGGHALCRIWNYMPRINELTDGLENYRAFCRGRARAFEERWGAGFERRLPAGSAVGGPTDVLAVLFALTPADAVPVENPEQVPAYAYPPEHGPRPPSFSRATRTAGREHDWVFVSGTAAIKGHHSVAPGELEPQIACTLHNLLRISQSCGLGSDLGRAQGWQRHFKVYLRRAADFTATRIRLESELLAPSDSVVWLQADICRAELELEIEATLWRRR